MEGNNRMSNCEANDRKGVAPSNPRRPYVKPAFCSEQVLEVKALACAKASGTMSCSGGAGYSS